MGRGGARAGAGRPQGSGKFGESTQAIRVPSGAVEDLLRLVQNRFYRLPLYDCTVAAGFPSPADGQIDRELDLNELLIKHPAATFFLKVSGLSMVNAGIHPGDILVVDRSLKPSDGRIVIAAVNGELTVKRLCLRGKEVALVAENEDYSPIVITEGTDLHIWGVVTSVIHPV